MNLPSQVDIARLHLRVQRINAKARNDDLEAIDAAFTQPRPDWDAILGHALGAYRWFTDEGDHCVPTHVHVCELSLDLVKLIDLSAAASVTPANLTSIHDVLASLSACFAPDGRIDEARYDDCARTLRELVQAQREDLGETALAALEKL